MPRTGSETVRKPRYMMQNLMRRTHARTMMAVALLTPLPAVNAAQILTSAKVIEASVASDWRQPDPQNLMLLELEQGEVLFELAPDFAPVHIANIRTLVKQRYFDGLAIVRSQENYVVQWGDPAETPEQKRDLGKATAKLQPEFFRSRNDLKIQRVVSRDAYADEVGFVKGFPVAADPTRAWLTHCYGMLGAGRGMAADSGNGAELYVVTGHAPRHLDRNVTLLGRALYGMQHLLSLPRGTGPLGFYESEKEYVPIKSIRIGADIDEQKRNIEVMRTDTLTFNKFVRARTTRLEEWFVDKAGNIEVCNIAVPMRFIEAVAD